MLDGIEVKTGSDFFEFRKEIRILQIRSLFTGMIDEYFGYKLGALEYRSVNLKQKCLTARIIREMLLSTIPQEKFRIHESLNINILNSEPSEKLVISREYSSEWKVGIEPYYPVNNEQNDKHYLQEYQKLGREEKNMTFVEDLETISIMIWIK